MIVISNTDLPDALVDLGHKKQQQPIIIQNHPSGNSFPHRMQKQKPQRHMFSSLLRTCPNLQLIINLGACTSLPWQMFVYLHHPITMLGTSSRDGCGQSRTLLTNTLERKLMQELYGSEIIWNNDMPHVCQYVAVSTLKSNVLCVLGLQNRPVTLFWSRPRSSR